MTDQHGGGVCGRRQMADGAAAGEKVGTQGKEVRRRERGEMYVSSGFR